MKQISGLMDVFGPVVYYNHLQNQPQGFDFNYLAQGTYYLQIITGQTTLTKTIIITE